MGSFRSEPETNKHTQSGSFEKIQYAVSHMCGTIIILLRVETLHGRCAYIRCSFY